MYHLFAFCSLLSFSSGYTQQWPLQSAEIQTAIGQPAIGFGTWNLNESPSNTSKAVSIAIQSGYRQIDCAAAYGNEKEVGAGIKSGLEKAELRRGDIWVTSKLWNDHHSADRVEAGLNRTLSDLGLDYLDLYLMHWPVGKGPSDDKYHYDYVSTWHSMSKLLKTGRVRNIGVSNFSPHQLSELLEKSEIKPAVHQMELHPYLPQSVWLHWHQARSIAVTAYSPLGNMNPTYGDRARRFPTTQSNAPLLLENEVVKKIAEKRGCTPAQVVLAWGIARGTSVIPKSKHQSYIEENIRALNCKLNSYDFKKLEKLVSSPTRFNNPSKAWNVTLFDGLDDGRVTVDFLRALLS